MAKLPAFQFYPGDWLSNTRLQVCSMAAQGLFITLMCYMHQSDRYGYLLVNGAKPDRKQMMKLTRMNPKSFTHALSELLGSGVIKEDENGVLYCRRMIEDQRLREIRKEAGSKGGNPVLVKQTVNQQLNRNPTPSVSSSVSSSSSTSGKDENKEQTLCVRAATEKKGRTACALFDSFWSVWQGKKVERKKCLDHWQRHRLDDRAADITAGLAREVAWRANAPPGTFVPQWKHPIRWLRGECWNDQLTEADYGHQDYRTSGRHHQFFTERAEDDPGRARFETIE